MRRARRHVRVPPDLTSLFDVLFIVIFAALIRAAAVEQARRATPPRRSRRAPPVPLEPASLHARALAELGAELAARPAVVVRVSAAGTITALEADGKTIGARRAAARAQPRSRRRASRTSAIARPSCACAGSSRCTSARPISRATS